MECPVARLTWCISTALSAAALLLSAAVAFHVVVVNGFGLSFRLLHRHFTDFVGECQTEPAVVKIYVVDLVELQGSQFGMHFKSFAQEVFSSEAEAGLFVGKFFLHTNRIEAKTALLTLQLDLLALHKPECLRTPAVSESCLREDTTAHVHTVIVDFR